MKHSIVKFDGLKFQFSLNKSLLKINASKPMKKQLIAIMIVVLLFALPISGCSRSEDIEEAMNSKLLLHSEKTLLATVQPQINYHYEVFSPEGSRVAYVASKDGKYFVVIGNKEGEKYDEVGVPIFSRDGKQIAYTAKKGKEQFIIVGENRSEGFDLVSSLIFRTHDNQITCLATKGRKNFLVVGDSRVQLNYPYPSDEVFSHDGKQLAYVANTPYKPAQQQKKFIVVGDRKGEEFTFVRPPIFSPNGRSLAYAASNLWGDPVDIGKWFIVVNGVKRRTRYSYITSLTFGPDGKQLAYVVRKDGKSFVLVGDKEGEKFDLVSEPLVFNTNGTQIAYQASKGEKDFIVIGDQKGEEFDGVEQPVYSPNGKKVAYKAVSRVRGKSIQYVIIVDKKDEAFDPIFGFPLIFSPDSRQVAYQAKKGEKMFIVVGDKVSEEFDRVDTPVFSFDGKTIEFGAKKGNKLLWNVMPLER